MSWRSVRFSLEMWLRRVKKWWSSRTWTARFLVIAIALLICMSLAFMIVLLLYQGMKSECTTKECIISAGSILAKMDRTANPCEDFYQFACGTFVDKRAVLSSKPVENLLTILEEENFVTFKKLLEKPIEKDESEAIRKIKTFYSSCLNADFTNKSTDTLLTWLTEEGVGSVPMLEEKKKLNWTRENLHLERSLGWLNVLGINPFFQLDWQISNLTSSHHVVHLGPAQLIMKPEYFTDSSDPAHKFYIQAYDALVRGTFLALGVTKVDDDINTMMEFEASVAPMLEKLEAKSSQDVTNEDLLSLFTPKEMEEKYPQIKWTAIFRTIFTFAKLNSNPMEVLVHVTSEEFFDEFLPFLNDTDPRTVAHLLSWRFLYTVLPYLEPRFSSLYADFHAQVPTLQETRPQKATGGGARWVRCVDFLHQWYPAQLTDLYVTNGFDQDLKTEAENMVKYIKKTFYQRLPEQVWLGERAQLKYEEKINSMKERVGYSKKFLEDDKRKDSLKSVLVEEDSFLLNILHTWTYIFSHRLDMEKDWSIDPVEVSARYLPSENILELPLSLLAPPLIQPNRPKYLDYGALGSIIGHELGHIFDNTSFPDLFETEDKDDHIKEVLAEYQTRARCLASHYSEYTIEELAQAVDGNNTLDQNIADNVGLQLALMAYLNYELENGKEDHLPGVPFNAHQIIFIIFSQIWCEIYAQDKLESFVDVVGLPGKYRVLGTITNSPSFGDIFKCPAGSPMNPESKCDIFV